MSYKHEEFVIDLTQVTASGQVGRSSLGVCLF